MNSNREHESRALRLARALVGRRLQDRRDEVIDDLETLHATWVKRHGRLSADIRILYAVTDILILGVGVRRRTRPEAHSTMMYGNYLKLAVRGMRRRPGYTGITMSGLAVGLACCLLILGYARQQWTYDAFHDGENAIFRVNTRAATPAGETEIKAGQPIPLAPTLLSSFDDVVAAAPVITASDVLFEKDGVSDEETVLHTDREFFNVFTFPLVAGNAASALDGPESIVLTASTARKYFGTTDVLGRVVRQFVDGAYVERTVAGVAVDPPGNSSLQFSALQPLSSWGGYTSLADRWTSWVTNTYVRLSDPKATGTLSAALPGFTEEHYAPMIQTWRVLQWLSEDPGAFRLELQPLREIHFSPDVQQASISTTDPRFPLFLLGLGFAVLAIACINFTTLAVGRATRRAKEVGMRKALGADRIQLLNQFGIEALLLTALSGLLGLVLARAFLPVFETLTASRIHVAFDVRTGATLAGLLLVAGLVAGAYPAAVLSRFKPDSALRPGVSAAGSNRWLKVLVVAQFTLSIGFIFAVFVISSQVRFMQQTNLGFDREELLVIETNSTNPEESDRLVAGLRSELATVPAVVSVGASSSGFNRYLGWQSFGSDGGDAHTYFVNRIDRSFLQTLGMEVIGGRGFTETYPSDPDSMLVVNEALVRDFGWDDPVGRPVGHLGRVAGVIRDYNFESLHSAVEPMALFLMKREDEPMRFVYVRLTPGTTSETIDRLEAIWQRLVPDRPFDWYFLNDDLNRQYVSEQHTQRLLSAAGLFALAIACFGLFGLAAFAAERRTKEIGIRKVVGAGVPSLVALVAREFLVLVAIATCFAVPAAWAFLNRWLDGFANRVDIALWMPVAASVAALTIALLTVSYHAVRAATADPVGSLRAE